MLQLDHIPFWPFLLITVLSAIVLYTRAIIGNTWTLMFRSTYNSRAVSQLMREENVMENSYSGLLVFIFFMSLALLFFNIQEYLGLNSIISIPFFTYLLLLFMLAAIYISKVGILYLLNIVFEKRELFNEYVIVFMNINIVMGITLIPLSLIYSYGIVISQKLILIFSVIVLLGSIILRLVRVFELGLRYKMKWYNIILYLCTLEILPAILIMTVIKNIGVNLDLGL